MKFLRNYFQARQRKVDVQILWPALKDAAVSLEEARIGFFLHATEDRCWTDHYTSEELLAFTETLK